MSRPISHRHGLFALSLPFGKIKIARNDLPEAAQFFFAEIIFCYDGVLQMGAAALKSGKTHKFFFCVGTIIDNFGSRLTMHGVMYLVLHFFEELYGNFGVRVVIYARCVDIEYLTVKNLFGSADITDALQKLLKVSASAKLFQPVIIQRKAFTNIFIEPFCSPLAKLCAAQRFYAIADRNNDIKIVVIHSIGLTVCGSCCKICNNCFTRKFALFKNIFDVSGDRRLIPFKKRSHLIERQPYGFSLKANIDFYFSVFGLEDDKVLIFI